MKPAEDIPSKLLRKSHTLGNTFGHLQNAYARYFNTRHGTVSGLFEKHYERKPVEDLAYFHQLVVYHHRNPQKHGITDDFRAYHWTSYQELSHPAVTAHVDVARTIGNFGGPAAFFAAHGEAVPPGARDFEFQ